MSQYIEKFMLKMETNYVCYFKNLSQHLAYLVRSWKFKPVLEYLFKQKFEGS